MWTAATTRAARVSAENVWTRWSTPALWPEDDPGTRSAFLAGPVAAGVRGWVQPRRGPKSKLLVIRAEAPYRIDFETRFPGAVMSFEHELHGDGGVVQLTHRIVFRGPLAGVWGRLVGSTIARGFPAVIASIVHRSGGQIVDEPALNPAVT